MLVNYGALSLVVSDRLLALLLQFRMEAPEVFCCLPICKRDKRVDYNILIANTRIPEYVGWPNSKVYHKKHFTEESQLLDVRTAEEYRHLEAPMDTNKEYLYVSPFRLNFSAIQHDIFLLPRGCAGVSAKYIVSEEVVRAVQEEGFTGIKFEPLVGR